MENITVRLNRSDSVGRQLREIEKQIFTPEQLEFYKKEKLLKKEEEKVNYVAQQLVSKLNVVKLEQLFEEYERNLELSRKEKNPFCCK